jgi:hypothetical protein
LFTLLIFIQFCSSSLSFADDKLFGGALCQKEIIESSQKVTKKIRLNRRFALWSKNERAEFADRIAWATATRRRLQIMDRLFDRLVKIDNEVKEERGEEYFPEVESEYISKHLRYVVASLTEIYEEFEPDLLYAFFPRVLLGEALSKAGDLMALHLALLYYELEFFRVLGSMHETVIPDTELAQYYAAALWTGLHARDRPFEGPITLLLNFRGLDGPTLGRTILTGHSTQPKETISEAHSLLTSSKSRFPPTLIAILQYHLRFIESFGVPPSRQFMEFISIAQHYFKEATPSP